MINCLKITQVIQKIFGYEHGRATEIMLSVHNKGKGVCGIFSKEIAEMKCNEINNLAQAHEHPLLSEIEPLSDYHLKIVAILSNFPKFVFGSQPLLLSFGDAF